MAAKRGRPPGRRSDRNNLRNKALNENYRLVERSSGTQTAYVIQRCPKAGLWFDMEGFDSEVVARRRFKTLVETGGVEDRILDTKIKHTRAAKVLAQGETEKEESET